jgi:hypothetical protein
LAAEAREDFADEIERTEDDERLAGGGTRRRRREEFRDGGAADLAAEVGGDERGEFFDGAGALVIGPH